ncbi:MAG: hypothetical protein MZV64_23275 [Ignavibacteriales bacterium]|nr:hypothetical protein [Ignavibacteriales bacterium]
MHLIGFRFCQVCERLGFPTRSAPWRHFGPILQCDKVIRLDLDGMNAQVMRDLSLFAVSTAGQPPDHDHQKEEPQTNEKQPGKFRVWTFLCEKTNCIHVRAGSRD